MKLPFIKGSPHLQLNCRFMKDKMVLITTVEIIYTDNKPSLKYNNFFLLYKLEWYSYDRVFLV